MLFLCVVSADMLVLFALFVVFLFPQGRCLDNERFRKEKGGGIFLGASLRGIIVSATLFSLLSGFLLGSRSHAMSNREAPVLERVKLGGGPGNTPQSYEGRAGHGHHQFSVKNSWIAISLR